MLSFSVVVAFVVVVHRGGISRAEGAPASSRARRHTPRFAVCYEYEGTWLGLETARALRVGEASSDDGSDESLWYLLLLLLLLPLMAVLCLCCCTRLCCTNGLGGFLQVCACTPEGVFWGPPLVSRCFVLEDPDFPPLPSRTALPPSLGS